MNPCVIEYKAENYMWCCFQCTGAFCTVAHWHTHIKGDLYLCEGCLRKALLALETDRNTRMTKLRDISGTESCCECGEDYPRADLILHGHIFCPKCSVREKERILKREQGQTQNPS
jgi:hypothetical protein